MTTFAQTKDIQSMEISALAAHVLGNPALATRWLHQPALALDGLAPINLLTSEQGKQTVRDLLLRIEYGTYS